MCQTVAAATVDGRLREIRRTAHVAIAFKDLLKNAPQKELSLPTNPLQPNKRGRQVARLIVTEEKGASTVTQWELRMPLQYGRGKVLNFRHSCAVTLKSASGAGKNGWQYGTTQV
jgi:hypothetical protein